MSGLKPRPARRWRGQKAPPYRCRRRLPAERFLEDRGVDEALKFLLRPRRALLRRRHPLLLFRDDVEHVARHVEGEAVVFPAARDLILGVFGDAADQRRSTASDSSSARWSSC